MIQPRSWVLKVCPSDTKLIQSLSCKAVLLQCTDSDGDALFWIQPHAGQMVQAQRCLQPAEKCVGSWNCQHAHSQVLLVMPVILCSAVPSQDILC